MNLSPPKFTPAAVSSPQPPSVRAGFPSLAMPEGDGRVPIFFDGAGGTQVHRCVVEAMVETSYRGSANIGGYFETSRRAEAAMDAGIAAMMDLLGNDDPGEIIFGNNMTTLAFHLADAVGQTWGPGDVVIVSRLDHDANVRPWVRAAELSGVEVRWIDVCTSDCTLDLQTYEDALTAGGNIRFVAVGAASNAVGTANPIGQITRMAHQHGALMFVDAVHATPHRLPDVKAIDCDFFACSPYKFYGPHCGVMYGRRELLESLPVPKVLPATDELPVRWMTGTQNHEAVAGTAAAVDYLASLADGESLTDGDSTESLSRRERLVHAYDWIQRYETQLLVRLLDGIEALGSYQIHGITDRNRMGDRCPTLGLTHDNLSVDRLARHLGKHGVCCWSGDLYAHELIARLGLAESGGVLRLGLMNYNTADEVDQVLAILGSV